MTTSKLVLVALLIVPTVGAQFAGLVRVAREELRETNTPGAAVAVVSGDKIVFAKGFGMASIETEEPVTADTLFRLGSTTKMMTAAVLLMLAEEGKVALDAPVGKYIRGLSPRLAQLTAHQLLTHTAGLKDSSPSGAAHDDAALGALVRSWRDDFLFTKPGDVYSYSNPGFILAGLLLEEVAGKPYADAMRERLFEPLGMKRTALRPTEAMTYPLAQGHSGNPPAVGRPFYDNSGRWPAGSVFTSANDFARFAIAFLNGRLPRSITTKMSTPYADVHDGAKYGYGLRLREYRGVKWAEHAGSLPGFVSSLRMAPEQRFAVVALANKGGGSLNRTTEKAAELLLTLQAKPAVETPKPPPAEAKYAGVYAQGFTTWEVVAQDGRLVAKQGKQVVKEFRIVTGADGHTLYLYTGGRSFRKVS